MITRRTPVFSAPWHAQVFALTVHLNDTGRLDWPAWTRALGATLERHGLSCELDGGDDYFHAWLEALEAILQQDGTADGSSLQALKADWTAAYLATPHGTPVRLAGPSSDQTG